MGTEPFIMMYSSTHSKEVYEKHFPNGLPSPSPLLLPLFSSAPATQALIRSTVLDWIWLGIGESNGGDSHGHQLLAARNEMIGYYLSQPGNSIRLSSKSFDRSASYVISGIGSSEAHARYLIELLKEAGVSSQFVPIATPVSEIPAGSKLVVFSQGMSPHTQAFIEHADVLFTCARARRARAASALTRPRAQP
jgi:hypothetical protein